jgi:hypothetical protein
MDSRPLFFKLSKSRKSAAFHVTLEHPSLQFSSQTGCLARPFVHRGHGAGERSGTSEIEQIPSTRFFVVGPPRNQQRKLASDAPNAEIQSVIAYDRSGKDGLAAKSFARVLIRGPHRMSFFSKPGARNLRPYSKQLDQKNDQSIYRVLAVDRAPLPSLLARMRPGTRANGLLSEPVPTRLRLEEYPLRNVSPRAR